jgi:serpin B
MVGVDRLGRWSAALIMLGAVIGGCGVIGPAPDPALANSNLPRAQVDPSKAVAAASAANAFGFDLYHAVEAQQRGSNVVISPASVAIALAMARAGARTDTAAQMDTVLRSLGADQNADAINALDQALATRSDSYRDAGGNPYDLTLTIANAPFAQRDFAWQPAFLDALAQRFGAGVRLVDYKGNAEAARGQINGWVSSQTQQRIPELLAPGTIDALTRLALVNAIYLKAPWEQSFSPDATKPGTFSLLDGSTEQAPMMAIHGSFEYAEGPDWQAIDLSYVGNKLALTIILPDSLANYEQGLDGASFDLLTTSFGERKVDLTMPRFSTETRANLAQLLSSMGMPLPFDAARADFSGMTAEEQLFIAAVIHQANISVDEKGTEASVATAVILQGIGAQLGAPPTVRMDVDRPFLFALRDRETGVILFLGEIVAPSTS